MTPDHVGKWCFIYNRYFYGFFETEQETIAYIQNFNPSDYIERSRYIFTLRGKILPIEDRPLGIYPLLPDCVRGALGNAAIALSSSRSKNFAVRAEKLKMRSLPPSLLLLTFPHISHNDR